ncbi:putative O-methyltransferase ustE [Pseudocercospora fuligena]|uniref:Putative O-methyltransferase ustE n=1 Tax=Pseudocercospora fuligena TaxID=685502 RepID=A0A8H6VNG9_9PEZI|nr:putative O-methyltransferase ustE [Pseudocercospora fuligena]
MANTGGKSEDVTPGPSSTGYKPNDFFWTTRRKEHSLPGTIIFVTLRLLDLPLQWYLLRSGLGIEILRKLGATPVTTSSSTPITFLGLSPYHTLIFALAVGSSAKQIYWKLFIGEQLFAPGFATVVSVYNTLLNSFNTLLALWAYTSQQPAEQQSFGPMLVFPPDSVKVGKLLFGVGMYLEWYSEIQRKEFKKDERNRGKPYSGGLWSLARNINYGGKHLLQEI